MQRTVYFYHVNIYKYFFRPFFFLNDPEVIHHRVFNWLKIIFQLPGIKSLILKIYGSSNNNLHRKIFGINFPNPVGLAAGFDKDAKLFNELAIFGFGFIEVGTVTPLPQHGNEKPRMFRLTDD